MPCEIYPEVESIRGTRKYPLGLHVRYMFPVLTKYAMSQAEAFIVNYQYLLYEHVIE